MPLPNYMLNKLHSYHKHTVKAEQLRVEIEEWFIDHGVEQFADDDDLTITDILIDSSISGFDDEAIRLLEETIK
ncbi:hypothetical protein ABD91_00825 [Lysinibacillus sphaericus]|uniref:hypothetical protein n=1 Tax=Lysinibacillus sphaericus TaxID=1421 RepID=UPI0018CF46B8|nr:hypothetical protein [Lysinibacillus sphaericus]MBG9689470.1 hypothetical protein [Lysinibacillus sphaericus]